MADNYGGITGHLRAQAAVQSQMKTSLEELKEPEYQAMAAVRRDPSARNMADLEGIQRTKALYMRRMRDEED